MAKKNDATVSYNNPLSRKIKVTDRIDRDGKTLWYDKAMQLTMNGCVEQTKTFNDLCLALNSRHYDIIYIAGNQTYMVQERR